MKLARRSSCFAFAVFAALWGADSGSAQAAPADPPADPFQTTLDRIGAHATSGDWRKDGWQDKEIETWLDQLVTPIIREAGLPSLKMPVKFTDVRPIDATPEISGGLVIGKNTKLDVVRRSIVLSDGDVEADRVEDSIIIARGSIFVGTGKTGDCPAERSILAAGTYVYVELCGRPVTTTDGNIVVSRGWVDALHAFGSVLLAPEGISVLAPNNSVYINVDVNVALPPPDREHNRGLRLAGLPLGKLSIHPFSAKMELLGVVYGRPIEKVAGADVTGSTVLLPVGLAFRFEGRRYVAMLGQEIVDQAGNPVAVFHGWKLKRIESPFIAFLDTGGLEAVVRIDKK